MDAKLDEALLRDLTQPLVAEFSPAEQGELFPLLSDAHFADPQAYAGKGKSGGPLAFGLPELTVLLTPVLLAAMNEVVRYIVDKTLPKGTKITANAIRRLFGRRRGAEPADDAALVLTAQQWSEVGQIVERVAIKGGVGPEQVRLIVQTVVSQGRKGDDLP